MCVRTIGDWDAADLPTSERENGWWVAYGSIRDPGIAIANFDFFKHHR